MTSRDFVFWLQGFFEIKSADVTDADGVVLEKEQIDIIRKHLNLVFKHEIDPSMGDAKMQKELNEIHDPMAASVPLGEMLIRC
jgi:hypothetical protein